MAAARSRVIGQPASEIIIAIQRRCRRRYDGRPIESGDGEPAIELPPPATRPEAFCSTTRAREQQRGIVSGRMLVEWWVGAQLLVCGWVGTMVDAGGRVNGKAFKAGRSQQRNKSAQQPPPSRGDGPRKQIAASRNTSQAKAQAQSQAQVRAQAKCETSPDDKGLVRSQKSPERDGGSRVVSYNVAGKAILESMVPESRKDGPMLSRRKKGEPSCRRNAQLR